MFQLNNASKKAVGYAVLILALVAGSGAIVSAKRTLERNVAQAEEDARAARVDLTVLIAQDCEECSSVDPVINAVGAQSADVLSRRDIAYDSDEGQKLIARYSVTKIPSVIITGEIDKANIQPFFSAYTLRISDAAVWADVGPVYLQPATGDVMGRVALTYLNDASCADCYDPAQIKDVLTGRFGMAFRDERNVDVKSTEGKELVTRYAINSVPTVLLSGDAKNYPALMSIWDSVGSVETDGTYVFRTMGQLGQPVYRDLETGNVMNKITTE